MADKRFQALDSFRGFAALIVALYHFMVIDISTNFYPDIQNIYIENLWLFTDFFFVLSGFILSYRYYSRAVPLPTLIKSRFFRLFPLQIFTALIFSVQILHTDIANKDIGLSLLVNILNLQLFFTDIKPLNLPSWSISAEFYFSILLGALFFAVQKYQKGFIILSTIVVLTSLIGLAAVTDTLSITYGKGWLRGLFGLGLGCVVWWLFNKAKSFNPSRCMSTCLEAVLLASTLICVFFYKSFWFLLPDFVFCGVIFIFALERGRISSFLKKNVFLKLGEASYSIYLTHFVILFIFQSVFQIFGIFHDTLINNERPWVLPLCTLLYFAILISCAMWSYNYIENPWRAAGKSSNARTTAAHQRFAVWRTGRR